MYSVRFQTTSDSRLPPPDLPAAQTWDRLADLLEREVGPEAARLLAEPVVDPARGETHWHAECEHDPIPLASLPEAERTALLAKLDAIRTLVEARATVLQAQPSETSLRTAAILSQIIEVPDETCIWAVDGRPVLSCWGRSGVVGRHADRTIRGAAIVVEPVPAPLASTTGTQTGASAAASATAVPVHRRTSWFWSLLPWLAFLALLAVIYTKLLAACGLLVPEFLGGRLDCPIAEAAAPSSLRTLNDELRRSVAGLQARLSGLEPCATPGATPPDRQAVVPDKGEVEKRLGEQQLSRGRLDVSLAWNGHADLDLHVSCPGGEVGYKTRRVCGANLDRDANNDSNSLLDRPVEHATWHADPPSGHYRIEVELFDYRDTAPGSVPYTVVIRDGATEKTYQGVVTRKGERKAVIEFDR